MADNWMYHVKSNTLQKRLYGDMEAGIYTDVAFMVGPIGNQRAFKAHRLVLAAENSEFEKILETVSGEITIPDVHPKGFENLIRYCYGVGFRFLEDLSAVRETLLAAEKFKVELLKLVVENHLIEFVKSEQVIEILQISTELEMPRLQKRCLEIISSRFEKVLMTEKLVSAPLEIMELILSLCPDHGLEFRICALVTLLGWAKKHKCPKDVIRRLLSMVQVEHIACNDIVSVFKTKIEQLTENQLREFMKDFFAKEFCALKLNPFIESTDTVGNTAAVSPTGTITKDEASEKEQKILLQEAVIDQAKMLELKDEKEIVVDQEEASELKNEKETNARDNFNDDGIVTEKIIEDMTNHASELIKSLIIKTSEKTKFKMTEAVYDVIHHASGTMQKAIDVMVDSFKHLYTAISKDQKAEITTTDLMESSSLIVENESESKMEDI